MPVRPDSNQLKEWYKKFSEILLEKADIDVTKPQDLGRVKNFQIAKWDVANYDTPDVKVSYAYMPHNGSEPVVPAPERSFLQQSAVLSCWC